jgi:hypothetical protein
MRLMAALVLLALTCAPLARASDTQAVAAEAHIGAAREAIQVILFSTGIYDRGVDATAPQMVEHVRERIEEVRTRQSFSAHGEAALDQFTADLPTLIRSEMRLVGETIVDATADRTALLFSVDEWRDIATFFANEDAQQMLMRVGLTGDPTLTGEERELALWYRTPSGQAFSAHDEELFRLLFETWDAQIPSLGLRLSLRVNEQFCTALGDECPPDIRELIARD